MTSQQNLIAYKSLKSQLSRSKVCLDPDSKEQLLGLNRTLNTITGGNDSIYESVTSLPKNNDYTEHPSQDPYFRYQSTLPRIV